MNPAGGANGSPLRILIFDNFAYALSPGSSYLRVVFRPSHDTPPAQNVDTSPLLPNNTQDLLNGVAVDASWPSVPGTSAPTYGLPSDDYQHGTMLPVAYTISGNNSASFELTVEVTAVVSGSTYYYKVDPEMMIDF